MKHNHQAFLRSGGADRVHIEALLSRYPEVSAEEDAEILRFMKKSPALDVALLSTADIRQQLARFRADHRKQFELGLHHYLGVLFLVAMLLIACAMLWDIGLK